MPGIMKWEFVRSNVLGTLYDETDGTCMYCCSPEFINEMLNSCEFSE